MHINKIENELKKDSYSRGTESSLAHFFLIFLFLGVAKNYLLFFKEFLYICLTCFVVNFARYVVSRNYLKNLNLNKYSNSLYSLTLLTGLCWGALFSIVYLRLGIYQAPTIALFIIVSGTASAATSSLFAQKKLLMGYLFFTVIMPGLFILFNEINITEKFIGALTVTFFAFLTKQGNVNRKNLVTRIELSQYLSDEADRLEKLFNSVPGMFCYFKKDGQVLASNKKWRDFSKCNNVNDDFRNGMNENFIIIMNHFIESSENELSVELEFVQDDQNSVWYICTAHKDHISNAIVLFMVETTSLKKIQEELKLKDSHFQHSARLIELGEMVGSIAHEINNPLTVLSGRAQFSKRLLSSHDFEKEKMLTNLDIIIQSSQRISKLVKGMKSLVRNAENDSPTNQSMLPHLEIVKFLTKNKADLHNVDLQININTPEMGGFCRPSQIEQVLINLINNAIDAAESTTEKWVQVNILSNNDYLVFEVADSGKGIEEQVLKKIWNPFFTTKEVGKGTGLGLSISHSIILENNGKMYYAADKPNTTFIVEIPKSKIAA